MFRCLDPFVLAGGPLVVEAELESPDRPAEHLAVVADRARQRPADFSFAASVGDGVTLRDPFADAPVLGGPATTFDLSTGLPLRQRLLVNQYLDLERAGDRLRPGETSLLLLSCRRRVAFDRDPLAAIAAGDAPIAEVVLRIPVRRDDAALATLVDELAARAQTDAAEREGALTTLIALRNPAALRHLRELADDPAPDVAVRAAAAVRAFDR